MITFGVFCVAFIFILAANVFGDEGNGKLAGFSILVAAAIIGYGVYRVNRPDPPPTPEELAAVEKRKADIEAAKIPKILSTSDDGCTVYKFSDNGYNHYFTRCESQVTTNSTYRSGKSTRSESISTQK